MCYRYFVIYYYCLPPSFIPLHSSPITTFMSLPMRFSQFHFISFHSIPCFFFLFHPSFCSVRSPSMLPLLAFISLHLQYQILLIFLCLLLLTFDIIVAVAVCCFFGSVWFGFDSISFDSLFIFIYRIKCMPFGQRYQLVCVCAEFHCNTSTHIRHWVNAISITKIIIILKLYKHIDNDDPFSNRAIQKFIGVSDLCDTLLFLFIVFTSLSHSVFVFPFFFLFFDFDFDIYWW